MDHLLTLTNRIISAAIWVLLYYSLQKRKTGTIVFEVANTTILYSMMSLFIGEPQLSLASVTVVSAFRFVKNNDWQRLTRTVMTYLEMKGITLLAIALAYAIVSSTVGYQKAMTRIVSLIVMPLLLLIALYFDRRFEINRIIEMHSLTVAAISLLLFILSYTVIEGPYQMENQELNRMALFSVISLLSLLGLWTYDSYMKQRTLIETQKQVENLIRKAHKDKSLIPATRQMLQSLYSQAMQENSRGKASTFKKALNEIAQLAHEMGLEVQSDYIRQQLFHTTGLILLDNQLIYEQNEAFKANINFEVVVKTLIPQNLMKQIELQRVIGDLIQNARKAASRNVDIKEILLIFANSSRGYSIKISDSGPLFVPDILNHIGERGKTDGGTGHGFADLLETLLQYNASLEIEEYAAERASMYTKAITITFDGLARVRINSSQPTVLNTIKDASGICEENKRREKSNV